MPPERQQPVRHRQAADETGEARTIDAERPVAGAVVEPPGRGGVGVDGDEHALDAVVEGGPVAQAARLARRQQPGTGQVGAALL